MVEPPRPTLVSLGGDLRGDDHTSGELARPNKWTELLKLEVGARQGLADDYAAGLYQPRIPTSLQERLRKSAVSYLWLLVQLAAIIVDLAIMVEFREGSDFAWWATVVTSLLYLADILIRMYAMGTCEFLMGWFNRVDIVIIYSATVGAILQTDASHVRAFRLIRIAMVMNRKLRHITGQNKQRFLSLDNDLDIDLAYVTPRLIAMSVPAEDYITRLYRNDLRDVVRFFHLFHAGHFHIMNLCPELPYNSAAFGSNPRTRRPNVDFFCIQDHTPPLMSDFLRFFKTSRGWMGEHEENVLAVHCRGGKGRTGSLCCAWLLYNREAKGAQDAMNIFAITRTNLDKRSRLQACKLQGVETPSQVRYVRYVDTLLTDAKSYFPEPVLPPKISRLRLQKLTLTNLFVLDKHQGIKLVAAVHVPFLDHKPDQEGHSAWRVIHWSPEVEQSAVTEFDLGNVVVSKDTRVTVFKADRKNDVVALEGTLVLAGTEPGCLFYFLFHTFFHREEEAMHLSKSELDKAWKSGKYQDDGAVTLDYVKAPHT